MKKTAKESYDDKPNLTATIDDISPTLVSRFLYEVESHLFAENYTNEELLISIVI
jgi:hypothetical protein